MSVKSDILLRLYIVFGTLCFVAFLILAQAFRIQFFEGDALLEEARVSSRIDTTQGERGNLYSSNNRLLATSLPFFELRFDTKVVSDSLFKASIDSLAYYLANEFKDKSQEEYRTLIADGRKNGKRYLLVKKNVNYNEKKRAEKWPLFRLGRYKGGFIAKQYDSRVNPFRKLAQRTIGYVRESSKPVGIEGTYNHYLSGASIAQSMYRINGEWVPMDDDADLDIRNGKDVYTSIDIDMQDKVESYLHEAVLEHQAKWGTAVVMEVKTGEIKAIANLGLKGKREGPYRERFNYAIGQKGDPGSTFKVISLVALLEDGKVNENTIVNLGDGKASYYDHEIKDSWFYPGSVTLRKMMEISSNVGISKLVSKGYGKDPQQFINRLESMNVTRPTGVDIVGEVKPNVKSPDDKDWSGITLPWMSMGHEVELTPLQMLTFVNAIANDGKMMRPYVVTKVAKDNKVLEEFKPQVIRDRICSKENAQLVRSIMQGVVREGTAKSIYLADYPMGAKTGTAEISIGKRGYQEDYQASIVGFFPVEKPVYSCIVVINEPLGDNYYGGKVAGPVFQKIVTNCLAGKTIQETPVNNFNTKYLVRHISIEGKGFQDDFETIYNSLGIPSVGSSNDWITPIRGNDTMLFRGLSAVEESKLVPNVVGMGLRDAIYKLENAGLKVRFTGRGKVQVQSPISGKRFHRGDVVALELGI